jgi:hypothetical protein
MSGFSADHSSSFLTPVVGSSTEGSQLALPAAIANNSFEIFSVDSSPVPTVRGESSESSDKSQQAARAYLGSIAESLRPEYNSQPSLTGASAPCLTGAGAFQRNDSIHDGSSSSSAGRSSELQAHAALLRQQADDLEQEANQICETRSTGSRASARFDPYVFAGSGFMHFVDPPVLQTPLRQAEQIWTGVPIQENPFVDLMNMEALPEMRSARSEPERLEVSQLTPPLDTVQRSVPQMVERFESLKRPKSLPIVPEPDLSSLRFGPMLRPPGLPMLEASKEVVTVSSIAQTPFVAPIRPTFNVRQPLELGPKVDVASQIVCLNMSCGLSLFI